MLKYCANAIGAIGCVDLRCWELHLKTLPNCCCYFLLCILLLHGSDGTLDRILLKLWSHHGLLDDRWLRHGQPSSRSALHSPLEPLPPFCSLWPLWLSIIAALGRSIEMKFLLAFLTFFFFLSLWFSRTFIMSRSFLSVRRRRGVRRYCVGVAPV